MRVCIVGCGAVGSLFAANLGTLDDVEVWAYDLARDHVEAINRDGLRLTGAGDVRRHGARDGRRRRAPGLRLRHRRDQGDAHRRRDRRDRPRLRGRRRRLRAERDRERGGARPPLRARDPRHHLPGREGHRSRASSSGTSRATRRSGRSRPKPAATDEIERLADACTRAGMPTKAVADARGPQWRKVIFNAATNPLGALTGLTHGRVCEQPPLRRLASQLVDEGKAVAARAGHRARLRPRGADRLRGAARGRLRPQGVDAPGRRGAPSDRGRLPERRHRRVRPAPTACRRRRTR